VFLSVSLLPIILDGDGYYIIDVYLLLLLGSMAKAGAVKVIKGRMIFVVEL
jgi:hypothetical protein